MNAGRLPVTILGITILALFCFVGCSASGNSAPLPGREPIQNPTVRNVESDRVLWGVWQLRLSPDEITVEAVPLRDVLEHYDVTSAITPPECRDCLRVRLNLYDPDTGLFDCDVTLRNPTVLTGHDVRGILFTNQYGHVLLNPDAWTGLYDVPGGDTINPFRAFAKGTAGRTFAPQAQHTENYLIHMPDPPHWDLITYAAEASWPDNCGEPYEIAHFAQEYIFDTMGSKGEVRIDVLDWQDDVTGVEISAPDITGEDSTPMSYSAGNTWSVSLINNEGAAPGDYEAWITATSNDPTSPELLYKVNVTITKEPKITLDPDTTYQTITGWEAVAWAGDYWEPAFDYYRDELFDRVVNEAGINRVRLELRSGAENSTDYFDLYYNHLIDYDTWRANRYATVNDNSDPFDTNENGFHFSELDFTTQRVVLPLMDEMAARGESLYIDINYVAFTGQITTGQYHHDVAEEYAEFILAAFNHLDQTFGFTPDAIEILLEPDNVSQWNGTSVGNAIVALVPRLHAAGFYPEVVAPSCTAMGNNVNYFNAMLAVDGAIENMDELSYHRYSHSYQQLLQIVQQAQENGLRTAMLEWWSDSNGLPVFREDLETGLNSAWEQGVIGGASAGKDVDNGMSLYVIDNADPENPIVRINKKTRLLRQYYLFVRSGAVRIDALTDETDLHPNAFINADGGYVVVVQADAAGEIPVLGLPSGDYSATFASLVDYNDYDITLSVDESGGVISVTVPEAGVVTIHE
jgi:hypothetical protein